MSPDLRQRLLGFVACGYKLFDRRDRLVVLSLHRVGPPWPIGREVLRRHLEYLRARFRLLTPSALLAEGAIRGQVALVVVDDAHGDIYQQLYPLARALGVPFAIAVPTDFFLRRRWLWFDALAYLLENTPQPLSVQAGGQTLVVRERASVAAFKARLKRCLPEERTLLLDALARALGVALPAHPTERYRALTAREMREMLASGLVEICPHSVTHTVATVMPPARLEAELAACKAECEEFARRPCPGFCYPDGERGTYDARTARALEAAGFRLAFTSVEGINLPATLEWFALRRVHIHTSLDVLRKHASGLGMWLERWRSRGEEREPCVRSRKPDTRCA